MVFSSGCCLSQEPSQTVRPDKVEGWKDSYFSGVHSIAELVLSTGESSDNGELGVKVIEIISPEPCAEGYAAMPKAVLSFYRASDKHVLCEATFTSGGTFLGNGPPYSHCTPEVSLSAISIKAINTKEGWVWFDLRK
jgi:hypothetical protein